MKIDEKEHYNNMVMNADCIFKKYVKNDLNDLGNIALCIHSLYNMKNYDSLSGITYMSMNKHKKTLKNYFCNVYNNKKYPVLIFKVQDDVEIYSYTRSDLITCLRNTFVHYGEKSKRKTLQNNNKQNSILNQYVVNKLPALVLFKHTYNDIAIQEMEIEQRMANMYMGLPDFRPLYKSLEQFKNTHEVVSNISVIESIILNIYHEIKLICEKDAIIFGFPPRYVIGPTESFKAILGNSHKNLEWLFKSKYWYYDLGEKCMGCGKSTICRNLQIHNRGQIKYKIVCKKCYAEHYDNSKRTSRTSPLRIP